MKSRYYDPVKCLACKIEVTHSPEEHQDYLTIWCETHHSWCGDHTHTSIKAALEELSRSKQAMTATGRNKESGGLGD